jgi:hypothetical protein
MKESATITRGGSARLGPVRNVKYNLLLTEGERRELDRRAVAQGYSSAADYIRAQALGQARPDPRSGAA